MRILHIREKNEIHAGYTIVIAMQLRLTNNISNFFRNVYENKIVKTMTAYHNIMHTQFMIMIEMEDMIADKI